MYTPSSLGLDGYLLGRDKVKSQFITTVDRFRQKMNEFTAEGSNQMIFTEDLKNMIHLAEQNGSDTELIVRMLRKFAAQNQELRFGSYVFGPVIMRMFYHLNDEETALKCFKDKELTSLFNQWASYQILLDMLYDKKRYNDVLETYQFIQENQIEGGNRFPKHAMVIVFASCYKLNTPESYKYMLELWKEMAEAGFQPMRRITTFAAALALAQNAPHVALEILFGTKSQNYTTVRNLKVLAMLELGRVDDVIPILRSVLESRDTMLTRQTFSREVVNRVKEVINKSDNKELQLDFERIEKFLNDNGHISDGTIDDQLCGKIDTTQAPGPTYNKQNTVLRESFSRNGPGPGRDRRDARNRRAGLTDMY